MPKVVDKEEMKQRIMDAAMIVYSDEGFHVATMDAIAKQSGLGKGTVYLYFKSKEAIMLRRSMLTVFGITTTIL